MIPHGFRSKAEQLTDRLRLLQRERIHAVAGCEAIGRTGEELRHRAAVKGLEELDRRIEELEQEIAKANQRRSPDVALDARPDDATTNSRTPPRAIGILNAPDSTSGVA